MNIYKINNHLLCTDKINMDIDKTSENLFVLKNLGMGCELEDKDHV